MNTLVRRAANNPAPRVEYHCRPKMVTEPVRMAVIGKGKPAGARSWVTPATTAVLMNWWEGGSKEKQEEEEEWGPMGRGSVWTAP